jgi:hypothetical protein
VQIRICRDADTRYWNGRAWDSAVCWVGAQLTGTSWRYQLAVQPENSTYTIKAVGMDSCANTGAYAGVTVDLQFVKPQIMFSGTGSATRKSGVRRITGRLRSGSADIDSVRIALKTLGYEQLYWAGPAWTLSPRWHTVAAVSQWSLDTLPLLADGEYVCYVKLADTLARSVVADSLAFTIDHTPPQVVLLYPSSTLALDSVRYSYVLSESCTHLEARWVPMEQLQGSGYQSVVLDSLGYGEGEHRLVRGTTLPTFDLHTFYRVWLVAVDSAGNSGRSAPALMVESVADSLK